MGKDGKPKKWWAELFLDHPGLDNKDASAYVESGTMVSKSKKVYCMACMPVHVEQLREEDRRLVNEGRITTAQNDAKIQADCELIN